MDENTNTNDVAIDAVSEAPLTMPEEVNGVPGEVAALLGNSSVGETPAPDSAEDVAKTTSDAAPADADGTDGGDIDSKPVIEEAPKDTTAEILAQLAQTQQQLVDAQSKAAEATVETPAETPASDESKTPDYAFDIPDALVNALVDEDPAVRKQGLQQMIQGTAKAIHTSMFASMQAAIPQQQNLDEVINTAIQNRESRKAVYDDFYGTYETLNKTELHPIVQKVAAGIMETKGTTFAGYTTAFGEEVAKRTYEVLGLAFPGKGTGTKTKLATKPPVALSGGAGARPAATKSVTNGVDDVRSLLNI